MSKSKQVGIKGKSGKSEGVGRGSDVNGANERAGGGDQGRETRPEWKPNVEFFTGLSKDGRFVICKTIITAIKPVRYFEKVLEGKNSAVGGEGHCSKDSDTQSGV